MSSNTTTTPSSSFPASCGGSSASSGGLKFTPDTTAQFFQAYLSLGVPFTVVACCAAAVLCVVLRFRLDRAAAQASMWCSCARSPALLENAAKHARCVYWLGRGAQFLLLTLPLGLLLGWGAATLAVPGAAVVGLAIMLLFSAFFLLAWATAAWGAHGYAFAFGGSARRVVPLCWGAAACLVFAFNGLAVFLDDSFSFIGVSWFFTSLNMIPVVFITHWNEPGAHEGSELWRRNGSAAAIREHESEAAGAEAPAAEAPAAEEEKDGEGKAVASSPSSSSSSSTLLRDTVAMYVLSIVILGAYALTVLVLPSSRCTDFGGTGAYTGLVTAGAFLVIDLVTMILRRSHLLTNPALINTVLLLSRGCVISFGAQLWYMGHAAMVLVYGLIIGTICVHYRLRSQRMKEELVHMSSAAGIKESAAGAATEPAATATATATAAATPKQSLAGLTRNPMLALFVMVAVSVPELVVIIYMYGDVLPTITLVDGTAHHQYEFGCGALFVVLAWATFYWWYCVMRRESRRTGDRDMFTFNSEGKILLGAQIVIFVGGGVGLFIVTKSYIVLFSSIFVPMMVISGMLLYGRWRANDFFWLQNRSLRKNTRKIDAPSDAAGEGGDDESKSGEEKTTTTTSTDDAAAAAAAAAAGEGKEEGATHTQGDEKTVQEIEDQHLDGAGYHANLFCDAKNAENADALCGEGCGKCTSHWGQGDFRRTHCCIACFRGGLTPIDYYTIAGLVVLFVSTVLWGVLIYVTEPDTWVQIRVANANATAMGNLTNSTVELLRFQPDSKRIGPVLTMITLTLLFTLAPLMEHFQTLRPIVSCRHSHMLVELVLAGLLHSGLHVYIWQVWQDGVVNTTSLSTLLSFLLYPSAVMLGIGLYKWRDDKWLRGSNYKKDAATAVAIYIGISQLLLLAFDILVGLVYDWFAAAILLVLHASGLVVMAALVVWVLHGFYLPRKWRYVVGAMFVLIIAGGIAGSILGQGTDAFLSFSASWCALLLVLLSTAFSTLYPKLQRGDLYFAETVLPVYEWNKEAGRIVPHRLGVVALYGAYFMALSWGVAATLFLTQLYIGMTCSSFTLVVISITTVYLSHHSRTQFSSAIASLEASAYLVLDGGGGGGGGDDGGDGGGTSAGAEGNNAKGAKEGDIVQRSLREALTKAHGLFSSSGAAISVDEDPEAAVAAEAGNSKTESSSSASGSGLFSIKRYSSLPPPSSTSNVLTRRVLAEIEARGEGDHHSNKKHPTAEDLSDDIRCIEAAIAEYFTGTCCGGKKGDAADASAGASDGGDLEMASGTGSTTTTSSSDIVLEDASNTKPVRYDQASLPVLLSTLLTLDYDYTVTISHENDIAAAFRNYVSKIANAQVAHSEARFQGFLDWARLPDQATVLQTHELIDVFGQAAQVRASRAGRAGGVSPIALKKVFAWRQSKPERFTHFQRTLDAYREFEGAKNAERARRAKESADAERERQKRLRDADERRRASEADEYRRKHAAEAKEMEEKRQREIEERRKKAREKQARRREELRARREREQKEEEERRRKEDAEAGEAAADAERRAAIARRREARRKQMEEARARRERQNDAEEKRAADRLRREEEQRRRDDDDAIIHRLRAGENNKFMTDALYTDKALQHELAASKLELEPPAKKKFVDRKWTGDGAVLIDPKMRTSVGDALLGRRGEGGREWMRPEDFVRNGAPELVHRDAQGREGSSGFDPSDVCQGSLGDCWFLSAMAVVAAHPTLMRKVFVTSETSKEGFYIVRIFKHGEWHNVVVDDKLLVLNQRGYQKQPVCVKSKNGHELWMSILEKAYSKFHGSYEAINGGQVHVGLADLTGGIADSISLEKKQAEIASGQLFHEVKKYHDSGYLMGAGSPAGQDTDVSDMGIVQGHAYSVLGIAEESDSNGTHQLIKLRNPWGATEWKGDWSDRDQHNWTSRMRQRLGYDAAAADTDDGSFWMSWQDFCRNYSTISLCRMFELVGDGGQWHRAVMQAEWKGKTAGGLPSPQNKNAKYNPQFLLKLSRPGHVFIQLEQTKPGHVPGRPSEKKSIAAFVLKLDGKRIGSGIYGGMIKNTAPYINADMVSMEIPNLRPDPNGYTILCTTYGVSFWFWCLFGLSAVLVLVLAACVCFGRAQFVCYCCRRLSAVGFSA
jgi:hypothetical protein